LAETKACQSTCPSFKCSKNSSYFSRGTVWCRLTDELCNIKNCTYPMCYKRRLLPQGICGETIKRKTVEKEPEDLFDDSDSVHLKGKALRKLGDKDYF
jgi:hypothetical protein